MKEIIEESEQENQNNSNDIKTSTIALKESQSNDINLEIKEEKNNNNNIDNDSDNKITPDFLKEIIGDENQQEEEKEKDEKEEDGQAKTQRSLSHDEMIENELAIIKKKNLSKYLMEDNQFKSSSESEEEINPNNSKYQIKPKRCQLYKFVGRTLFVFLDRYENPLLIIGPHWGMYVCFCGIITILMLTIYFTLWNKLGTIMRILGHISFWSYFLSYTHCSLFNPGYPKNNFGRNFGYPRSEYTLCSSCNFYVKKSHYSHHCFDCDICIENYDHHCPWTGHCIGKNNIYTFYVFIGSSFLVIIYIAFAFLSGVSKML